MARVLKQEKNGFTVALEIEASVDEVNQGLTKAFNKLVKSAKLPGFRKGKITRKLFEASYGKEMIVQEAIHDIINLSYGDAIQSLNLAVVDYPKDVNIGKYVDDAPLTYTCSVDVEPSVTLGKYTGVKATKLSDVLEESAVDIQINQLLERQVSYTDTENASADGDIVLVNLNATIDGQAYEPWSRDNIGVRLGMGTFGTDFDAKLVGTKKGDTFSFSIDYPADFATADVAGKSVAFSGSVAEVRAKTLPELTVELVKTFGDFESVDAFKAQIRDNLSAQLAQDSKAKLQQDLLDAIVSELTVEIPEGMVRQELDSAIHDFTARIKQQLKMEFDQYLKIIGKTIEDIRTEWRADAIKRIKTELAIKAISEKESLTPSDTELDAEIQKLNLPNITTLSEFMASKYAPHLERLNTIIKRQKALDFILDNAKIS